MRDFTSELKPGVPKSITDVRALLRKLDLLAALKLARRLGIPEDAIENDISVAARKMFVARRCNEMLAAVADYGVRLPFDVRQIVEQAQSYGDHHSVVKSVFRLGLQDELRPQVERSITAIEQRAPREAEAWRRKLR